jgi:hypothetical protein
MKVNYRPIVFVAVLLTVFAASFRGQVPEGTAQSTAFSYQGFLKMGGVPANGVYDIQLALYDVLSGGSQIALATHPAVTVENGVFSVTSNFGNQFPDGFRFIEVRVRATGGGAYTALAPRQQIHSVPYAIRSIAAATAGNAAFATSAASATTAITATSANQATNASQLGGVPAANFVQSGADTINAGSRFSIGTVAVLSTPATDSLLVGRFAGAATTGNNNTFVGMLSGSQTTSGFGNTFVGSLSGSSNITGFRNTALGYLAGVDSENLSFATAIGSGVTVSTNDTVVIGRTQDALRVPGGLFASGGVTNRGMEYSNVSSGLRLTQLGQNIPDFPRLVGRRGRGSSEVPSAVQVGDTLMSVVGTGFNGTQFVTHDFGAAVSFVATENWAVGANGSRIDFKVTPAGGQVSNTTVTFASTGVGIRTINPSEALDIAENGSRIIFGGAGCPVGSVAIGLNGPFNNCTNFTLRGNGTDVLINRPNGGEVIFRENNGNTQLRLRSGGVLQLGALGAAGSTPLCRNATSDISTCTASIRYKSNIAPFSSGLELLSRLQPVAFNWAGDGRRDLGLVAEEVAEIEPLLTTTNEKGEVEGVKFDSVGLVLVNAVKEQQAEIVSQRKTIESQQIQIAALKRAVCKLDPTSLICKE